MIVRVLAVVAGLCQLRADAQNAPAPPATPESKPAAGPANPTAAQEPSASGPRSQLNLRNQTDTESGESRRNENVNFNPIDNNAMREVNLRLGVTATVVERFEPASNYFSAEFGTRPAAPLHIAGQAPAARPASPASPPAVPKRRFANVHGSIAETHHNSVFSARTFFQAGPVRPARDNQYGLNFSAPLWTGSRFNVDLNQQKTRGNVNGNVLVPNATERTPLTTDPLVLPLVRRYLAAYPAELPNRLDIDDRALNTNSTQRIDTDRAAAGLDQRTGRDHRLFLRYNFTGQRTRAFQFVAGQNPDSEVRAQSGRATWNRALRPSTVLDVSTGFDRVATALRPEANAVAPFIAIFIVQRQGNSGIPVDRAINEFRQAVQVRHAGRKHTISGGFSIMRRQFNGEESNDMLGTFQFGDAFGRDAVSNLRMGTPIRFTQSFGSTARGFRNWDTAQHVGDAWRVNSNLTLHLGLRYETFSRPVEVNGLDRVPFGCDCNNVAPTFGFARRVFGGGVVRGAYGVHFGKIYPATYGQVRFNPPGVFSVNVDNPYLADPLRGVSVAPGARSSLTVVEDGLATPYSHQYNFSWEPAPLAAGMRLQLGYAGSRTHKLLTAWSMNRARPVPGIALTTATVNQRRPDPRYFGVMRAANGSRAFYDAARVTLLGPQRGGAGFDLSYWFSKAIDLGADYTGIGAGFSTPSQNDWLVHRDTKAVSNFHQPHALLARGSYETPKRAYAPLRNWRTSAVLLVKSGTPFSIFSGSDAPGFGNVDGESGDRVDIVDPSILGRTVADPDTSRELLPRSAFAYMAVGASRGTIGRNTFRKGGIRNVNAAISRSWAVRVDRSRAFTVRLRAESVNLLNTPQFADPERNLTSKTFGRITNTLNEGRTFHFMLQVAF